MCAQELQQDPQILDIFWYFLAIPWPSWLGPYEAPNFGRITCSPRGSIHELGSWDFFWDMYPSVFFNLARGNPRTKCRFIAVKINELNCVFFIAMFDYRRVIGHWMAMVGYLWVCNFGCQTPSYVSSYVSTLTCFNKSSAEIPSVQHYNVMSPSCVSWFVNSIAHLASFNCRMLYIYRYWYRYFYYKHLYKQNFNY